METIKSIFEIFNSNLGGLFVLSLIGYALFKTGQFWQVFKAMPELVNDVHQLKNDVAQLQNKLTGIQNDMVLIMRKLGI